MHLRFFFIYLGIDFSIDLDKCPPPKGNKDWKSYRMADLPVWRDIEDIKIPQFEDFHDITEHLLLWIMSPYR